MKNNTEKKEVLVRIVEVFKEYGYTGYQVSSDTSLTDEGVTKILDGRTKNPRQSTIDILIDWLSHKGVSKNWLISGDGNKSTLEGEGNSIFDHKIELFNRMGNTINDDEFSAYFVQNKERLLNNPILNLAIAELVKDGILEYVLKQKK